MLHVRDLIEPLIPQTEELIEQGLLPGNVGILFNCAKTVKYPPFVYKVLKKYKWAFSHFGIFMEDLLREMLGGDGWKDRVYNLYLKTIELYTKDDVSGLVKKEDLYSCMGRFVNISKYIREDFAEKGDIRYNHEYNLSLITGHPDVICGDSEEIYDVKTTTKFNSPTMKNNAILQVTAYVALARGLGKTPKICGVILPFQQTTLTYNLEFSDYDHRPFLELLQKMAQLRIPNPFEQIELAQYTPLIGAHTKKVGGSVHKSLLHFYTRHAKRDSVVCGGETPHTQGYFSRPCQIFMRGNVSSKSITLKDDDVAQSLDFIFQHHVRLFVHSPYIINLCHPCGNKTKDAKPIPWAINLLREDLQLAKTVGGRGVVVHTGKGLDLSEEDAYMQMYTSVLNVIEDATEECPLMIETPVDKGSELCGSPESMAEFYLRFTAEQRRRLKICVDTCHVFAAGYFPYDYLTTFADLVGVESIALIHLNDAQWLKGSAHDGHAWIGRGCIGMTEMLKAIRWCAERGIPMVHE